LRWFSGKLILRLALTLTIGLSGCGGGGDGGTGNGGPTIPAPTFVATSLPDGVAGVEYRAFVAVSSLDVDLTWTVTTGDLPAGLNLDNSTGEITGTPSTTGSTTFTIQVTDSQAQSATQSFTVAIGDDGDPRVVRVSLANDGSPANSNSGSPDLSDDGRYLVFTSFADNLVAGDTNGFPDIFLRDLSCATTVRVSVASNGTEANNQSFAPALSSVTSGTLFVAYASDATNLVADDINQTRDIFVTAINVSSCSPAPVSTVRASVASDGIESDALSQLPSISADGLVVTYQSNATNLAEADTNELTDVFLTTLSFAGSLLSVADTRRVNLFQARLAVGVPNTTADIFSDTTIGSSALALAIDQHVGRVVQIVEGTGQNQVREITGNDATTFTVSPAWDPVPDDTSIFRVIAREDFTAEIASSTTAGNSALTMTDDEHVSRNRRVVIGTVAADIFSETTIGNSAFLLTENEHVDRLVQIVGGTGEGQNRRIIANDNTTFTVSPAWDLVPDDTSTFQVVSSVASIVEIVSGTGAGQLRLITDNTATTFTIDPAWNPPPDTSSAFRVLQQGNAGTFRARLSADGALVAFDTASAFEEEDTNIVSDVFVHESAADQTSRVSVDSNGALSNGSSRVGSFSADGGLLVFESLANNLVQDDANAQPDLFVRDLAAGETTRVSLANNGDEADNSSDVAAPLSGGGRLVAFASSASNLVSGDRNQVRDVFLRDRQTDETRRLSLALGGTNPNAESIDPAISLDGTAVVFASAATNLVPNDDNGARDVFLVTTGINDPAPPAPVPIILGSRLPPAQQSVPYAAQLRAAGGAQPLFWNVSQGTLPPGLFLDPKTGRLTGIPKQEGRYRFTVVVMDANRPARFVRKTLTLVVRP
jgi:hypothetical protein